MRRTRNPVYGSYRTEGSNPSLSARRQANTGHLAGFASLPTLLPTLLRLMEVGLETLQRCIINAFGGAQVVIDFRCPNGNPEAFGPQGLHAIWFP
jgi:hypothetical protein